MCLEKIYLADPLYRGYFLTCLFAPPISEALLAVLDISDSHLQWVYLRDIGVTIREVRLRAEAEAEFSISSSFNVIRASIDRVFPRPIS